MIFRPFTKTDWYGLAGAERGPQGELPLVAYNDENTVVVDAAGVFVMLLDGDGDRDICYNLPMPSIERGELVAKLLPDILTHEYLTQLGFARIQ